MNSRLLCGSCYRLHRCLGGWCRLSCYRLGGSLYGCLSGLCGLRLDRLARSNRSLRYPLRLCRSTRCTGGSSGTALLIKEHATAANRLESTRTLLATLLTVCDGRLRRAGRTGRYGTRRMSRCRSRRFRTRSRLGSLIGGLHRDVRAARTCRLAVHTVYRLAGSSLTGGGASMMCRLFSNFRLHTLSRRVLYRLRSIIAGFFMFIGLFVGFVLSFVILIIFCLSLACIAARLDLVSNRLQQTKTAHSPCTAGKNQQENSPAPRQHTKERQKTGNQGKNTQTGSNQQGNTARARSIKVGQRRGLCVLHDRNLVRVRGSRGRFANLRNRSRIGRRLGGFLHRVGGTGRRLRKSGRG